MEGESQEERLRRIDGMVAAMVAAYPSVLAPSFDPEERRRGVTALESEWELLKRYAAPSAGA